MKKRYKFLKKHMNEFIETYKSLQGNIWSLDFPVFLFDRDWFRLKKINLYDLKLIVEPIKKIRSQIKFSDTNSLTKQILEEPPIILEFRF